MVLFYMGRDLRPFFSIPILLAPLYRSPDTEWDPIRHKKRVGMAKS
jgi:hypothetical protein